MRNTAVNVLINIVKIKREKKRTRKKFTLRRASRNSKYNARVFHIERYISVDCEKFNFAINGSATPVTTKKKPYRRGSIKELSNSFSSDKNRSVASEITNQSN